MLVDGELVLGADAGGRDGRLHGDPVRDGGLRRAREDARRQELGFWKWEESQQVNLSLYRLKYFSKVA